MSVYFIELDSLMLSFRFCLAIKGFHGTPFFKRDASVYESLNLIPNKQSLGLELWECINPLRLFSRNSRTRKESANLESHIFGQLGIFDAFFLIFSVTVLIA